MLTYRSIGIVGSRSFRNWRFLDDILGKFIEHDDRLVSGGAIGVDSMAQRWAKENGHRITIIYPDYQTKGRGATFARNKDIVVESDIVLAFYAVGVFQKGGTANSAMWARKLEKQLIEYEEPPIPLAEIEEELFQGRFP